MSSMASMGSMLKIDKGWGKEYSGGFTTDGNATMVNALEDYEVQKVKRRERDSRGYY